MLTQDMPPSVNALFDELLILIRAQTLAKMRRMKRYRLRFGGLDKQKVEIDPKIDISGLEYLQKRLAE